MFIFRNVNRHCNKHINNLFRDYTLLAFGKAKRSRTFLFEERQFLWLKGQICGV